MRVFKVLFSWYDGKSTSEDSQGSAGWRLGGGRWGRGGTHPTAMYRMCEFRPRVTSARSERTRTARYKWAKEAYSGSAWPLCQCQSLGGTATAFCTFSVCLSVSLSLSLSVCLCLSLSLLVFLCLSVSVCLSVRLSLWLSFSVSFGLSLCLSLSCRLVYPPPPPPPRPVPSLR